MAKIEFDAPSTGKANDAKKPTLLLNNEGGNALQCEAKGNAIVCQSVDSIGIQAMSAKSKGVHGTGVQGVVGESELGFGVLGSSKEGIGVQGKSDTFRGVIGISGEGLTVEGISKRSGVLGVATAEGVVPESGRIPAAGVEGKGIGAGAVGVRGESTATEGEGAGVFGISIPWVGVHGKSTRSTGVFGESVPWNGVQGNSTQATGVYGESKNSVGVYGKGTRGVVGEATAGPGVEGISPTAHSAAVFGTATGENASGVWGKSTAQKGFGIRGESPDLAGLFIGHVFVEGNFRVSGVFTHNNGDVAEEFDIIEGNVDAGTVMVLNQSGSLQPSNKEYDRKVTGIISGARGEQPGIILASHVSQDQNQKEIKRFRLPIALTGRVYCKVDARNSSIEIGDLLTTSSTKGHAMKAEDPTKSFGAVIGKALGAITGEIGMIPVLVALQ